MSTIGDPFEAVFDLLQCDFCEDDDEILGNWKFERQGNIITIEYLPYPDNQSPYARAKATYRVIRLAYDEERVTYDD